MPKELRGYFSNSPQPSQPILGAANWMIAAGVATLLLGAFALVMSVATTFVSIFFLGGALILAAIFQAVFSVISGRWVGFGLHLLLAVLYGITGAFLLMNPMMGAATLTLMLSVFFATSGLFRVVASATMRFEGWSWSLFSGLVTTALGVYVAMNLREASVFLLGALFAIDLIFFGAYLFSFGVALRSTRSGASRHLKSAA